MYVVERRRVLSPVVVRELEEKLLIAVKEKENLEDSLQDRLSEVSVWTAAVSLLREIPCVSQLTLWQSYLAETLEPLSLSNGEKC